LIVLGVVANQYGYLHDLVWAKHAGAIYMGLRSYLLVAAGLVAIVGGCFVLWRSSRD
jgi:hypothetical protein